MTRFRLEVFPKDKYVVLNRTKLTEIDRQTIQLLYQPLVGVQAVSLYFLLENELSADQMWSKPNDHMWLLDFFNLNLSEIIHERKKLEGIGLLRSWQKKTDVGQQFIYELLAPLSPAGFFSDEILSVFLRQKLGDKHVERLQKTFSDKRISEEFRDITQSFGKVFGSYTPDATLLQKHANKQQEWLAEKQYFTREIPSYQTDFLVAFDFELLLSILKGNFIKRKSLTSEVMEAISCLSYLYQFSVTDMSKIILRVADDVGKVDVEALKKATREQYLFDHKQKMPVLAARVQPEHLRTIVNPQTEEERLLYAFETNSPLEILASLSGGAKPTTSELTVIENLMLNQKLQPGVVNVLIHYVLLKSDMKLSKNYAEPIAATFARKKITTVREAFDYLLNGQKQKTENAKKPARRGGAKRTEIVPKWMQDGHTNSENDVEDDVDELQEALSQFKKGGK